MFGSGILDTIIGLIFVFLLVSMLVTISNELIAGALHSRAKWLRLGIERLLGSKWAQDLYSHPLIGSTAQSPAADVARSAGPSYIASRPFATVLMALLHDSAASVREVRRTLQDLITTASDGGTSVEALRQQLAESLPRLRALITAHSHAELADAISRDLTALGERLKAPYTVADAQADIQHLVDSMQSRYVRQMIEGLHDERMRMVLLALFDDAQNDVEKFKENIEIWFNNSMDRISGWYKRRAQWVVAALAVTAAVTMNVDAVLIVKHLQTYPGARESLVAQAKAFAERTPTTNAASVAGMHRVTSGDDYKGVLTFDVPAASTGTVKLTSDTAGVTLRPATMLVKRGDRQVEFNVSTVFSDATATATISAAGAAEGAVQLDVRQGLPAQFSAVQDKLADLGLPIGWVWDATPTQVKNGQAIPRNVADGVDRLLQHFLGWFITALAATLGAPFWFDMLNRVISIRSTGRAPEEKPKAPKEVSTPVEPGQTPREADRVAAAQRE